MTLRFAELRKTCNLPNVSLEQVELRGGSFMNAVAVPSVSDPAVVVTDTLPAGLEHVNAKNPTATFDIGTLRAGKTRHIEFQVIAKGVGEHCNEATVTANGGLKKTAKDCVTVTEAKKE